MEYLYWILVFVFGAAIGSFVNVVSLRHNTGLSPLKGSSQCFSCGKELRFYELIPVFSYLWQRGRCRTCSARLSVGYFLAEIISGIFALLCAHEASSIFAFILLFSLCEVLFAILSYDLRHKIIPDSFLLVFAALALFYSYFILHTSYLSLLIGFALVPLPFFLIWLVSSGRYIGFGDVKFMAVLGLLLGVNKGFSAVLMSFWIGFAYVVFAFLISLRGGGKKLTMKSELPFAPFLVIGALLGLFLKIDLITNVLVQ